MPKLHIFDDDAKKLKLVPGVLRELVKLDPSWELGFAKPVQSHAELALSALTGSDSAVCLIDVEVKAAEFKDDFESVIGRIDSALGLPSSYAAEAMCKHYQSIFGTHRDYQWSVRACTYARLNCIPALIISTKAHQDTANSFESLAVEHGLPTITNWKPEVLRAPAEKQNNVFSAIANKINSEWAAKKGCIAERLWPQEALNLSGWFHVNGRHPCVKHDFPPVPRTQYDRTLMEFVLRLLNGEKKPTAAIAATTMTSSQMLHEALKGLVGVCARVHGGDAAERVPHMSVVPLLAAIWDPNAISWVLSVEWSACHPLMADVATKTQLRSAILALGGEEGLFKKLLVKKTADTSPPWDKEDSNVERVAVTKEAVTIYLRCCVKDLALRFTEGKKGAMVTGASSNALLTAWRTLEANGRRTVEIEVQENWVRFQKHE